MSDGREEMKLEDVTSLTKSWDDLEREITSLAAQLERLLQDTSRYRPTRGIGHTVALVQQTTETQFVTNGLTRSILIGRIDKPLEERLAFIDTYGDRITAQRECLVTTAQSTALIDLDDTKNEETLSSFSQLSDLYLHQLQLYIDKLKGFISEIQRAKRKGNEAATNESIDTKIVFIRNELQQAQSIFTNVSQRFAERAHAGHEYHPGLVSIGLLIDELSTKYDSGTVGRWWGHGQRAKRFEEIRFLESLRNACADNKVLRQALVTVRAETVESSSGASASCGMFGAHGTLLRLIDDILLAATPTSGAADDVSELYEFCEDKGIIIPDYLAKSITREPPRHSYR